MSNNLVIVVRAGYNEGLGHVARMLVLASFWQNMGGRVTFFVNNFPPALRWIEEEGYSYKLLDDGPAIDSERIAAVTPDIVIVDVLDISHGELCSFRLAGAKLVVFEVRITDLLPVDIVVTAIVEGLESRIVDKAGVRYYLGMEYMLYAPTFAEFQSIEYHICSTVEKILIFCGGTDPKELSLIALTAAKKVFRKASIIVKAGPGFTDDQISRLPGGKNIEIIEPRVDMASLYHKADLSIVSGGLSCFEALTVGVPLVALPQNEHQMITIRRLAERGLLCAAKSEKMQEALLSMKQYDVRFNYSARAKEIMPPANRGIKKLLDKWYNNFSSN